jgi:hypothetical protein
MIRDRTAECRDRKLHLLSPEQIRYIAIHRIHLRVLGIEDDDLDGPTMCRAFQTVPELIEATGGQNPYAFLGRAREGVIDQCTPILEMGAHAAVWNDDAVGIAVVGDWRDEGPTSGQWHNTKLLAGALSQALSARIVGHDELPGGSKDPDKACPGRRWPMDAFRADVAELVRNNRGDLGLPGAAKSLLARAGAVFGG